MKFKTFGPSQAARKLPVRRKNDNKSDAGRSLIIAGSPGTYGACYLAAEACARAGSGYTAVLTDLRAYKFTKHPDFLTYDLNKRKELQFSKFSAVAFGPGIGVSAASRRLLNELIKANPPAVLIDADGLNLLAQNPKKLPASWILTPHGGELSRLLGVSAKKINADRALAVKKAHEKFGCVILLKGPETLVFDGKTCRSVKSGTPALAKAGSGDVLTGIVTALLAQGLSSPDAAASGAVVHGLCARTWEAKGNDRISLLASDLVNLIPKVLKQIRKKQGPL